MSKYEIMLILDPSSNIELVQSLVKATFKESNATIEELKNIELAYQINKSKTGKYILININASGDEINEFNRKCNISKEIWRNLSINLDTEKGLNRKAAPKRVKKVFIRKPRPVMEGEERAPRAPREPREFSKTKKEEKIVNE
ncbi:MAG: 30S ribosomal protein S6 [Metamycoplasmataceae bacterium]